MPELDTILGRTITRRAMLQGTALAGVGAFLAACGTAPAASRAPTAAPSTAPSAAASATSSAVASATPSAPQTPSAVLNFANWPLYIDQDTSKPPKSPTLEAFTKKYGTKVNYSEVINDNEQFFGVISPSLQAGQDTGWDLIVMTDWMAERLIRLGWVETIDTANTPNFTANVGDIYKGGRLGPEHEPARALAVRHDRPRLRQEGHRRRDIAGRPVGRPTPAGRARSGS